MSKIEEILLHFFRNMLCFDMRGDHDTLYSSRNSLFCNNLLIRSLSFREMTRTIEG